MAYTSVERVKIRQWLGYSGIVYTPLESQITATQSTADGGSMPDAETEGAIRGWLTQLDGVLTRIQGLRTQAQVLEATGDAKLDAARGIATLAKEGRLYVGFIADAVQCRPARDVFTPSRLLSGSSAPYSVLNP
jgi:hypothetical protein